MKSQQHLLAIAMVFATSITGLSNPLSEEQRRSHLQRLRSETDSQMRLVPLDRGYLDAHQLLDRDSVCSQFYGGSAAAFVLDELTIRLRARSIRDPRIGLRMSGLFTSFDNAEQGISYLSIPKISSRV